MEDRKVIYYEDELNDEFSTAKIKARRIDEKYKYKHNCIWDICSYIIQNVISMPIKVLYSKIKFRIQYIGREKLKDYKKQGYFIYANHTQVFADTFIPSVGNYPKRNFLIVTHTYKIQQDRKNKDNTDKTIFKTFKYKIVFTIKVPGKIYPYVIIYPCFVSCSCF